MSNEPPTVRLKFRPALAMAHTSSPISLAYLSGSTDRHRQGDCSLSRLWLQWRHKRDRTIMAADTIVRARIDQATKDRAAAALEAMGLSISDAIRLLMLRIADEKRLPFDVRVPNAESARAMQELEDGKGKRVADAEALFKELGI
jgi:DNA-damage-inducible protein J